MVAQDTFVAALLQSFDHLYAFQYISIANYERPKRHYAHNPNHQCVDSHLFNASSCEKIDLERLLEQELRTCDHTFLCRRSWCIRNDGKNQPKWLK